MKVICPVCAWEREAPEVPDDSGDVCMNCGTLAGPPSLPAPAPPAGTRSRPPWEEAGGLAVATPVLQDVARCVKCSARRLSGDLQCRFCNEDFTPREFSAEIVEDPVVLGRRHRARILILGLLLVLDAVLLVPSRRAAEPTVIGPDDRCDGNLQLLQDAYRRAQAGGGRMPSGAGLEFWRELSGLKAGAPELSCPLSLQGYRGPSKSWHELDDDGVILADVSGDHPGGGLVLHKNGTVRRVARGSPAFHVVLRETRP